MAKIWKRRQKNLIEISHLVKKYGSHTAVDDLSLTVEPGRIYGFLGPNGAGKSTTMNIVTGYLGATGGEVKINGYDILKQPEEAKKCIGYLPEVPPLYMDMTQAVLGYPEVIILDEPTVGLDPRQIIEMRELILKLGETHTVILSSHILSEVREVCDYIFIISDGKLVASDTTEHLLKQVEDGGREMKVLVRGDGEAAKELLLADDLVEDVLICSGGEEDTANLMIRAAAKEDIRSHVIKTLVDSGVFVLEAASAGKTLEDIFLELTNQKGALHYESDSEAGI